MKAMLLLSLFASFGAFAQVQSLEELENQYCQVKEFTGDHYAFRGDSCDMWVAETHALQKCERRGFKHCKRLPGRRGAIVSDGGSGQVCTVIVRGDKDC